jgi:hypothetical protein
MGATKSPILCLNPVADHAAVAMRATWCHAFNCTFEAVECHASLTLSDNHRLVIVVSAHITGRHMSHLSVRARDRNFGRACHRPPVSSDALQHPFHPNIGDLTRRAAMGSRGPAVYLFREAVGAPGSRLLSVLRPDPAPMTLEMRMRTSASMSICSAHTRHESSGGLVGALSQQRRQQFRLPFSAGSFRPGSKPARHGFAAGREIRVELLRVGACVQCMGDNGLAQAAGGLRMSTI